MAVVHRFDPPDRFVAGTVGEPGARTFFIQARDGARLVSVALEKQQVEVLATRVEELLDQVHQDDPSIETGSGQVGDDSDPLDTPIDEEFRVGTMTLTWDPSLARVVVEMIPVDADDDEPDEMVVVHLSAAHARAFARRASVVVGAGRPTCPFCGNSIDPAGHLCVRANGFRRRA